VSKGQQFAIATLSTRLGRSKSSFLPLLATSHSSLATAAF
jgi:hypothetical protein